MKIQFDFDVCVVGGCGRVGLPLALAFAERGLQVAIHDINEAALDKVRSGTMPFAEEGADELLPRVLDRMELANDPSLVGRSRAVIVIIGTPVDEHLNPTLSTLLRVVRELSEHIGDDTLLVLRSTLYPGTTERVARYLSERGKGTLVSFCPERIAEGKALAELRSLPQIVSGTTPEATRRATELFARLAHETVELSPFEAELAKLFTNSWRYLQFAAANQFYMMAEAAGADFYKIYGAMRQNYPRTAGFPSAGFVAGPCLFKDTMQLAALSNNNFFLGHAAMLINEGLPNFLVSQLKGRRNLKDEVVGVLGMTFKADSDDPRESLSFKLKRVLQFEAREVLCSDPFLKESEIVPAERLLAEADVVILGAPHSCYRSLRIPSRVELVDVWSFFGPDNFEERSG